MINIRQIKIEVTNDNLDNLFFSITKKLHIKKEDIKSLKIFKKSIDARDKNHIYYIYEVSIGIENENKYLKDKDVYKTPDLSYKMPSKGNIKLEHRPVIIGSGPAGLFAAYILALNDFKPIIIERGKKVEERIKDVDLFWKTGKLNINSNVSFGEGGAGTFSDGKLNTCISDENNRIRKVFNTFIECGAHEDILYDYKPHIGTDILSNVIKNLRNKIIDLGGTFLYNSCLTNIIFENNKVTKIMINNQDIIDTDILILAIGNAARDTYKLLYNLGLNMTSKNFAVGLRVVHPQALIDKAQYGLKYSKLLSPATYKLTYHSSNNKGVYSFCMCPGGYVVNSSSINNRLAINGMSYYKRDSGYANSAIIATVSKEDFGNNVLDGIAYQERLEKKAYELGQGSIPIQTLKDFYNNTVLDKIENISFIKGSYTYANLNELFSKEITLSIKEALNSFAYKINDFNNPNTILCGVETRTSSPVRICRDENFEANIKGIYPCGEGAGYAGGITSSAVDGIKVAEAIIKNYKM